jgi:predicted nuclease of predicted toxin-antitoxin system
MARILVDMNLSTEWIPLLQAACKEAVHWSEAGDPRAPNASDHLAVGVVPQIYSYGA